MFDIGWSELMVIAVVALVVIGPKDLPKTIYYVGKWVRKARGMAREFQHHVDDMMREAELDELRQQAQKARDFNLSRAVESAVDPDGKLRQAFDPPAPDGGTPSAAPYAAPSGTAGADPGAGPADAATLEAQPLPAFEPPVIAPLPPVAAEDPQPAVLVGPAPEPALPQPAVAAPAAAAPAAAAPAPEPVKTEKTEDRTA